MAPLIPMLSVWAGEVPYDTALRWQHQLVAARQQGAIDDVMLVLTHPPVYTAGRYADLEANLTGARPDIPVVRIDRGGELTYHGPGQVVAYPIVRLEHGMAAKAYVAALEDALIQTVATYGITAGRREGRPGVWVGPDKVAAIGVRVTRQVTKHGVALNVDPDLNDFLGIVPCGITDGGVTSLAKLGADADFDDARLRLTAALAKALGRTPRHARPAQLGLA